MLKKDKGKKEENKYSWRTKTCAICFLLCL